MRRIVTVGYGDIVPKTIVGKMITCLVMIFGVLFTAMVRWWCAPHVASAWPQLIRCCLIVLQPLAIVGNEFYNAVERDAVEHGESRRKKDEPPLVVSRLLDFEVIASRYVLLGSAMHDLGGQVEEWSRTRDGSHVLDAQDMASLQHKLRRWIRTHLTFVTPLKKVARPPGQAAGCFYATVPWSDLEEQRALNKPLTQRWSSRLLSVAHSEDIPVKAGWWPVRATRGHVEDTPLFRGGPAPRAPLPFTVFAVCALMMCSGRGQSCTSCLRTPSLRGLPSTSAVS